MAPNIRGWRSILRRFQRRGVRFIERRAGRALVADDMGLGKTLQAIAWLVRHPEARPALIVCPASVKHHWRRECQQYGNIAVTMLVGRTPHNPDGQVWIINYSILAWWTTTLGDRKPRALIIDECHYVKNRAAKRTKACQKLARLCPNVIALSGTPILSRPVEFFPVLNMIAPRDFTSFWKYAMAYCDPKPGFRGRGWDFRGASHVGELSSRVGPYMIRRTKEEVLKELPQKTRVTLPVEIDNRAEYIEAREHFLRWLAKVGGKQAARRAANAQHLVRLGKLKRLAAEGKLQSLKTWIKDWLEETGEKLVVFGRHRSIIGALHDTFPAAAVITGATPVDKREAEIAAFRSDKRCRVFLGNIQAAGTGLDGLQRASSTVLFAELGWTPAEHDQAEDRVLRIGQEADRCLIYYMIGLETIEEKVLAIVQKKRNIVNGILDGHGARANVTHLLLDSMRREEQ